MNENAKKSDAAEIAAEEVKINEYGERVYAVGFKGFEPGMICRGKQYAENTVFEEKGEPELCNHGMHFCENPLDVLDYYGLLNVEAKPNDFATVEALAPCKGDGDKSVTTKLRIGAKLDLAGFIKASFDFVYKQISGSKSTQCQSGDWSTQCQSGYWSTQCQSGYGSKQSSVGENSSSEATNRDCLVAALGEGGKVKGGIGCVLVVAEYRDGDNDLRVVDRVISARVDGKKIKADTWYTVKKGEFVEIEE